MQPAHSGPCDSNPLIFEEARRSSGWNFSRQSTREFRTHHTSLTRDSYAISRNSHRTCALVLVSTTFDAKTRITTLELHGIASNDRDSASNSDVERKRKSTSGPGALGHVIIPHTFTQRVDLMQQCAAYGPCFHALGRSLPLTATTLHQILNNVFTSQPLTLILGRGIM